MALTAEWNTLSVAGLLRESMRACVRGVDSSRTAAIRTGQHLNEAPVMRTAYELLRLVNRSLLNFEYFHRVQCCHPLNILSIRACMYSLFRVPLPPWTNHKWHRWEVKHVGK